MWIQCAKHAANGTLDQLPIGQNAVVDHVGGGRQVSRRLMEMGLLPGTPVETIRRAPLGDPLKIRLRGYLLSLRLADASQIALAPGAATEAVETPVEPAAGTYRFPPHVERSPSPGRLPESPCRRECEFRQDHDLQCFDRSPRAGR